MQRTAFLVVVLITLALIAFFGVVVWQPEVFAKLLGQEAGHVGEHFREQHHRVHDLTFSFLLGTALVGMLAQVRAPSRNVAGQLMSLMPFVGLLLVLLMTNLAVLSIPWAVVGSFTLLAATLHPAGRELFASVRAPRVDRSMLALVAIATVPLLTLTAVNIGLQRTAADDHAALGHYGYMAALGLTIIGVGVLASLRSEGWRVVLWTAGGLAAFTGLASLMFPDAASRLEPVWALAAIAWGVAFVAAGERARGTQAAEYGAALTRAATAPGDASGARPTSPVWAMASGIIVIVLVLLFVLMHLTGGGPQLHAPLSS